MNSIISQLFDGDIYAMERIVPTDPEYRPTMKEADRIIRHLKELLPQNEEKQLDELETLYMHASTMTCYAGFSYGLKLGIQFMNEVYS